MDLSHNCNDKQKKYVYMDDPNYMKFQTGKNI